MANRLLKLPFRSMVLQQLPDSWRGGERGNTPFPTLVTLPRNKKTKKYLSPIENLSGLSHHKGERTFPFAALCSPHQTPITANPNFHLDIFPCTRDEREEVAKKINMQSIHQAKESTHFLFCDGSQDEEGAGAGIVHFYLGEEGRSLGIPGSTRIGVGKRSTAYDAEMMALAAASSLIFDLTLLGFRGVTLHFCRKRKRVCPGLLVEQAG